MDRHEPWTPFDDDDRQQQQQVEQERLERTLEALDEINGCGLTDTAKFLAGELGVGNFWTPERI